MFADLLSLPATAEHDPPLGAARGHLLADTRTDGRIVDGFLRVGAEVDDFVAAVLQHGLEVLFELEAGVIGSDSDAHERSRVEDRASLRVGPDTPAALRPVITPGPGLSVARRSLRSMESVALPKVTPYLLRRADTMCARRLAEEVDGGTRSDDPVNRARLREVFLEAVRNIHTEMRAPVISDFSGIGHALEPEEQLVLAQAARWYVQLFGTRPVMLHEHGLDQPTESPRRGLRIGGWIDLTVVDAAGVKELRQFDLWCGRTPAEPTDPESVRLAVLRLSRWVGDDPLRVIWTDLVRGNQREAVVDARDIDTLRTWFDERVEVARRSIARPDAVNGPDCGQCNFVAGCPEHGSWHGRARGKWNDFRPSILRLSPSSLASWNRCRREWRNALLVVPASDSPAPPTTATRCTRS